MEGPESKCTRITAMGLTLCQCNIKLLFSFYFIIDVRFIFVEGLKVAKVESWSRPEHILTALYFEFILNTCTQRNTF